MMEFLGYPQNDSTIMISLLLAKLVIVTLFTSAMDTFVISVERELNLNEPKYFFSFIL